MADSEHDVQPSAHTSRAGQEVATDQPPPELQKNSVDSWPKKFGKTVDWTIATAERHWIVSLLSLFIGSCMFMTRDRTVTWEEEVPLNTGETIVVKRTGRYVDYGYDLSENRLGHKPDPISTIEFNYKGRRYLQTGEATLVLLAIAPDGVPNLIANAANWYWGNRNNYPCNAPYYVQFRPTSDGKEWTWPDRIDGWLYNQPINLKLGPAAIAENGKNFTPLDRQASNAAAARYSDNRFIDPTYTYDACIRRK